MKDGKFYTGYTRDLRKRFSDHNSGKVFSTKGRGPFRIMGTSNNPQFVTPAPYLVRGKLRRESSYLKSLWIPAFAGITFLEVALSQ